jgi:tetratricopeptide (TPR) repeat protein
MDDEIQAVVEASKRGKLAILAGAGISKQAPAYVPGWEEFNAVLLRGIKDRASAFAGGHPVVDRALERLTLDLVPKQVFSQKLVDSFAGGAYFPLLDVLDGREPNANHRALAELAERGSLRAIITTNFDTLIERAFRERGVPLRVCVDPADYQAAPDFTGPCVLYKIHGTAGSDTTYVDTVEQKVRGLSQTKRAHLKAVYGEFHTLVLGFSGWDLVFGEDYLALRESRGETPAVTWISHPRSQVHPLVLETLRSIGREKNVRALELSTLFEGLGLDPAPVVQEDSGVRQQVERDAYRGIAEQLDVTDAPLRAATLSIQLLREAGHVADAGPLAETVAAVARSGELGRYASASALMTLAELALDAADLERSELCAEEALAFSANPETTNPELDRALAQLEASSCSVLALTRMRRGLPEESWALLERAVNAATRGNHLALVATLRLNQAQWIRGSVGDLEAALRYTREGGRKASEASNPKGMLLADLQEATLRVALGEYDLAMELLQRAEQRLPWAEDLRAHAQWETVWANILALRGRLTEAWPHFQNVLKRVEGHPRLHAELTFQIVGVMARHQPVRDQLLALLELARTDLEGLDEPERDSPLLSQLEDLAQKVRLG